MFVYGLSIRVEDENGNSIDSATVIITQGNYIERLERVNDRYLGAGERPGVYRITVTAEGFKPFTRTGIIVRKDPCHVIPRRITIELAPLMEDGRR